LILRVSKFNGLGTTQRRAGFSLNQGPIRWHEPLDMPIDRERPELYDSCREQAD
jgi:hypothetical protein